MDLPSRLAKIVTLLHAILFALLCNPFCGAFMVGSRTSGKMIGKNFLSMVWKGDRPPLPNMEFLDQRMDAAWGRGKFRDEVGTRLIFLFSVFRTKLLSTLFI